MKPKHKGEPGREISVLKKVDKVKRFVFGDTGYKVINDLCYKSLLSQFISLQLIPY